jgi:hypothetical protein
MISKATSVRFFGITTSSTNLVSGRQAGGGLKLWNGLLTGDDELLTTTLCPSAPPKI